MSKHTPTPWNTGNATTLYLTPNEADEITVNIIEAADGGIVAYVPHDRDHEANAALLCTVPELSVKLEHIARWIDAFDKRTSAEEYTDIGDAWDLFRDIRNLARGIK